MKVSEDWKQGCLKSKLLETGMQRPACWFIFRNNSRKTDSRESEHGFPGTTMTNEDQYLAVTARRNSFSALSFLSCGKKETEYLGGSVSPDFTVISSTPVLVDEFLESDHICQMVSKPKPYAAYQGCSRTGNCDTPSPPEI
ncbi:hypothetical protein AVEN_43712-1 [Araneus ventricosus]|uniref:Uncharacterized protein n=1 Tax=Araneus ventricosus TaxID=182803 RepID=A0A4Y2BVV6_ARAVE|nr:hypothetical protein AVEN_43712-1 [Araneus ventricosus]